MGVEEEQNKASNEETSSKSNQHHRRAIWEEFLFGTIEKIASTPSRLKDPKESISSAFDWMKGIREEIGERVKEEVSQRIGKLDFNQIANKVADHLAKNYEMKIDARVQWKKRVDVAEPEVSEVQVKVEESEGQ